MHKIETRMETMKRTLLYLLMVGLTATQAHALNFNQVVIIGDSLSDGGQFGSRFTTNPGKTTAEYVADGLGLSTSVSSQGGSNYAYGGATVVDFGASSPPTLTQQVASYLSANNGVANSDALYQVWGGANDIFAYVSSYSAGQISASQLQNNIATSASTEIGLISTLKNAGASYVVVYNMPDIGLTPNYVGSATASTATALATLYNMSLDTGLGSLSDQGLNIIPVNVFGLLQEIAASPSQYGFSNVTGTACSGSSLGCTADGTGYLYADGVHPTAYTHQILAQLVLAEIRAPQQMALLSEVPEAFTQAYYRAFRQEMLNDLQGGQSRAFFNVDYQHQKLEATAQAPQVRFNQSNLTMGFDARYSDALSLGAALNVGQQKGSFGNALGDYDLFDLGAMFYALYQQSNGYLGGFLNAGRLNYDAIRRPLRIGSARRIEQGDLDGYHYGAGVDGGWWFKLKQLKTGPFAHLEWQTIHLDQYQEQGWDSTAMWFENSDRDALVSRLGWRLQGAWQVNGMQFQPNIELAWNHQFKDDPVVVKAGLNSMNGYFRSQGERPERNWGSANLGMNALWRPNLLSWVNVNTLFANDRKQALGANIGLKLMF
jgi:outer membrane lipase/esterase